MGTRDRMTRRHLLPLVALVALAMQPHQGFAGEASSLCGSNMYGDATQAGPVRCPTWRARPTTQFGYVGTDVVVSPSGNHVYVAAYSSAETGEVVAYEASTGEMRWQSAAPGVHSIAASPDGTKVFALWAGYPGGLLALDASTGALIWSRGAPNGFGGKVHVSPDSATVYAAARSVVANDKVEFIVEAHDVATGDSLWAKSLGGAPSRSAISPDGSTLFAATVYDGWRVTAVRTADGNVMWSRVYPDIGGVSRSLAVSPDGTHIAITGAGINPLRVGHPFGHVQVFELYFVTIVLDAATGTRVWRTDFDSPPPLSGRGQGLAVTFSRDGKRVLATGTTRSSVNTISYDAFTGLLQWVGSGSDLEAGMYAIDTSPDGSSVYVTGRGLGSTAAYHVDTGVRLWSSMPGAEAHRGNDLSVGPDGTVYTTGVCYEVEIPCCPSPSDQMQTLAFRG